MPVAFPVQSVIMHINVVLGPLVHIHKFKVLDMNTSEMQAMHVGTSFMFGALPWYSKASKAQSTSGSFAFKVDGGHAGTQS